MKQLSGYTIIAGILLIFSFETSLSQVEFEYKLLDSMQNIETMCFVNHSLNNTLFQSVSALNQGVFTTSLIDDHGNFLFRKSFHAYSDSLAMWGPGSTQLGIEKTLFDIEDSSVYLAGKVNSNYGIFQSGNYVMKLNYYGDTIWFFESTSGTVGDIYLGSDSTMVITGWGILRLNKFTGEFLDYGSAQSVNCYSSTLMAIQKHDDSSYYFCGSYNYLSGWRRGLFGLNTQTNNFVWAKRYTAIGKGAPYFIKMKQAPNSNFLILNQIQDTLANKYLDVLCLDTIGNVLWNKGIIPASSNGFIEAVDILGMEDNGAIVLANYTTQIFVPLYGILIRIDSLGNVLWSKKIAYQNSTNWVMGLNRYDSTTIIVNGSEMITIDTSGFLCNFQNFPVVDTTYSFLVDTVNLTIKTPGLNQFFINDYTNLYLVSSPNETLISDSCAYFVGLNETQNANQFSIYPRPAQDYFNISSSEQFDALNILDVAGRVVLQLRWSDKTTSQKINVSSLVSGVYFYSVSNKNALVAKGKMVKM